MCTILCFKAGPLYGAEYVNKLFSMCRRHFSLPFRFVCLTDDATGVLPTIESRPLLDKDFKGAWNKLTAFRPEIYDLSGPLLVMDIDVILVGDMNGFFTHPGAFCIGLDWGRRKPQLQGSIYRFELGSLPHVYERFAAAPQETMAAYRGEQAWLTEHIKDWSAWPSGWSVSYKIHCRRGRFLPPRIPKRAKIINFHGLPKPAEAAHGVWKDRYGKPQVFPKADWVVDAWT